MVQTVQPLDNLPLWGVFALTIALVLISMEFGFRVGKWRIKCEEDTKNSSTGSMVGAVLGLLAFMLAFTFGMAWHGIATIRHQTPAASRRGQHGEYRLSACRTII